MKKVSVALITYNHEKFITQAVESILMQEVDFEYEIVVGEDYSTDNTRNILIELHKQHPDKIRMLPSEQNIGAAANVVRTLEECQGEYVAYLDGDDYWVSSQKLQKQVDFFVNNPDFSICFTNAQIVYEDGLKGPSARNPVQGREIFDLVDILNKQFIPTCTVMFRNGYLANFPDWVCEMKSTDWLMFIMLARQGKIGYLDEHMATYRVHPGGIWSSMDIIGQLQENYQFLEKVNEYLGQEYKPVIEEKLAVYWDKLANEFYEMAIAQLNTQDALDCISEELDLIIEWREAPRGWKSDVLFRVYSYFALKNFREGDYRSARQCWIHLVKLHPSILRNLGMLMVGVEAYFGRRVADSTRKIAKSFGLRHDFTEN